MIERTLIDGTFVTKCIIKTCPGQSGLFDQIPDGGCLVTAAPETLNRGIQDSLLIEFPRSRHSTSRRLSTANLPKLQLAKPQSLCHFRTNELKYKSGVIVLTGEAIP
jgi:hypothetical protein